MCYSHLVMASVGLFDHENVFLHTQTKFVNDCCVLQCVNCGLLVMAHDGRNAAGDLVGVG